MLRVFWSTRPPSGMMMLTMVFLSPMPLSVPLPSFCELEELIATPDHSLIVLIFLNKSSSPMVSEPFTIFSDAIPEAVSKTV